MDLKNVADKDLLASMKTVVVREREVLLSVLHHFREIERRRLYCTLGYGSLFQYAVGELKYAEDQAQRRITAMRLLKELPEIEDQFKTGELSLTNLGLANSLFRKEKKAGDEFSRERKLEMLNCLENRPSREAARIVADISPEAVVFDRIRPVGGGMIEIKLQAPERVEGKFASLKARLAHSHPDIELGDLLDVLCDIGLQALDKTAAPRLRRKNSLAPRSVESKSAQESEQIVEKPLSKAGVRRAVWKKAAEKTNQAACVNCGSDYALEVDHIKAKGIGGSDKLENFRGLCRKCNQRAAIEQYGISHMEKYLRCTSRAYH